MAQEHVHYSVVKLTWFVGPNGQLDEIDMREWYVGHANRLARQQGYHAFIRRTKYDVAEMLWTWSVYETSTDNDDKVVPIKEFVSATIDQASMYVLMKGLHRGGRS